VPRGSGFNINPAIAELTAPAGLLFILALNIGFPFDRFFVRNLRRIQINFDAEFSFHLIDISLQYATWPMPERIISLVWTLREKTMVGSSSVSR